MLDLSVCGSDICILELWKFDILEFWHFSILKAKYISTSAFRCYYHAEKSLENLRCSGDKGNTRSKGSNRKKRETLEAMETTWKNVKKWFLELPRTLSGS